MHKHILSIKSIPNTIFIIYITRSFVIGSFGIYYLRIYSVGMVCTVQFSAVHLCEYVWHIWVGCYAAVLYIDQTLAEQTLQYLLYAWKYMNNLINTYLW